MAKFRAARRLWAALMRERYGASDRACRLRFHTQTAGSTLTAQQPLNNVVRTTVQAMAAVLGGTQSLHTNSYDEALGLPTDESATIALRTQQILANESGMTDTVDPLAGSYFVEALTDELEAKASELFDRVEQLGGAVRAIEQGFMQQAIEDAAYAEARRQESGDSVVVGVNKHALDTEPPIPVLSVDPALERAQIERLRRWRESRDAEVVASSLGKIESVARGSDNLLPPIREALSNGATVGEVSDALRGVFGVHRPS